MSQEDWDAVSEAALKLFEFGQRQVRREEAGREGAVLGVAAEGFVEPGGLGCSERGGTEAV